MIACPVVAALAGVAMLAVAAGVAAAQSHQPRTAVTPSTQSPIWLPMPATKTPELVQPTAMLPGASPYPRTRFPSAGGVIAQPQFVSPEPPPPASEVTVSNSANTSNSTRPTLPATFTPPRRIEPAMVHAEPKKTSRFWEFVLGPSPPAPANTTATQTATKPSSRSTTAADANARSSSSTPGGSLLSQLLGTSSPPPRPAKHPKADVSELANPFLLTSADNEIAAPPTERKPTTQDVEEAKTPATSMTISRPGLFPQMDVPIERSPESTPNMVGVPSVPTVSTSALDSIAAALWRPLSSMTNDAPTVAMPDGPDPRETAADEQARLPESQRVPSLLRPFYVTNAPPPTASRRDAGDQTTDVPSSITEAFIESSLGRQLSMMSDQDLRTSAVVSMEAEAKRDQQPWDGTVTIQWPLMANPFTLSETAAPPNDAHGDVAHVAFLQESLPSPPARTLAPDDVDLPGGQHSAADDEQADGEKKKESDTLVGAKTIGTAPEDNTLEFLRTQTVLLEPGKSQFDIGLQYTLTENDFPILLTDGMGDVVGVDNVEFKGRELTVPMELRYGLLRRVQGFVQVPVGWANVQAAINNFDEFDNDGGIGDVGFGLTAQLRDAYKDCPYLIGTLAGLAPTGGDPFGVFGAISPNAPSLGNGFWAISGNLLWVQTRYDPVVVFYGFGARYQFEHEYIGIEFEPGTEFNYTLGSGFAVNERVTLSAQFFGSYIEELKADGERVEGTIQEPMNLRLALTLAKPCNRIVEPFVAFGLTDDAISANFGITWTY